MYSFVGLPILSVAQPKQLIISARSGTAVQTPTTHQESNQSTESTSIETSGGEVNTLPLLNESAKTSDQIDQEIRFLNDCDRNFASRSDASDFFAARGWDYVDKGQLDTAAHRFNLSWLLNHDNVDAYWGLGVICYQKNHLTDAIKILRKGTAIADSNTVLLTDLATVEIKCYQDKPDADMLAEAEAHLHRAVTLNPNALSFQKLSVVQFLKADYPKAWEYFHQARSIDLSSLDLTYLNELLAKQPDPKGVFK
ncbi:tetratricopeptide repeat protein [Spirosoma profusum]|uniref:tetratricopeptide repeat protein n=1 Tax=Spirosoma profusum TaxID=2771354 RepID=UPI00293BF3D0|nr:tetratricopeptide repeat protein [Spirosoma profusum]